jgi:hypothetical protein
MAGQYPKEVKEAAMAYLSQYRKPKVVSEMLADAFPYLDKPPSPLTISKWGRSYGGRNFMKEVHRKVQMLLQESSMALVKPQYEETLNIITETYKECAEEVRKRLMSMKDKDLLDTFRSLGMALQVQTGGTLTIKIKDTMEHELEATEDDLQELIEYETEHYEPKQLAEPEGEGSEGSDVAEDTETVSKRSTKTFENSEDGNGSHSLDN